MNCYAVLGIPRDADEETIRTAYRGLARRYHPDRGAGSSAEKFRQAREAYETLIDPGARRLYDLSLRWAEGRAPVRVEPAVMPCGPYRQEDPAVFGAFAGGQAGPFRMPAGFEEGLDGWFGAFDDWFFRL
jgi:curved DNA-binding protein CbpA